METSISRRFSIDQCRVNANKLFVFGDNLERVGMGGQAMIREQANAIGIATKKAPGAKHEDYFTDEEYEANCKMIDDDIARVLAYAEEMGAKGVVFPRNGLGTGLADMPRKAPKTFCYLTKKLIEIFQFNNIEFLTVMSL